MRLAFLLVALKFAVALKGVELPEIEKPNEMVKVQDIPSKPLKFKDIERLNTIKTGGSLTPTKFVLTHSMTGLIIGAGISAAFLPLVNGQDKDKDEEMAGILLLGAVLGGLGGAVGGKVRLQEMPELHGLAYKGDIGDLKNYLKDHQELVNQRDKFGNTPLHYAVAKKNNEVQKTLLQNGADIFLKNNAGKTPYYRIPKNLLPSARDMNEQEVINAIKYSQDPNSRHYLHRLLSLKAFESVQDLINEFPNTKLESKAAEATPIHSNMDFNTLKFLLEKGADPNAKEMKGNNALQTLLLTDADDKLRKIDTLLQYGADPTQKNYYGQNALHLLFKISSDKLKRDPNNDAVILKETQEIFHLLTKRMSAGSMNAQDLMRKTPLDYLAGTWNFGKEFHQEFHSSLIDDYHMAMGKNPEKRVPVFLNFYGLHEMPTSLSALGMYHSAVEVGMGDGIESHYMLSRGPGVFDFSQPMAGDYPALALYEKILIGYVPISITEGKDRNDVMRKITQIAESMRKTNNPNNYHFIKKNCQVYALGLINNMQASGYLEDVKIPTRQGIIHFLERNPLVVSLFSKLAPGWAEKYGLNKWKLRESTVGKWKMTMTNFDLAKKSENGLKTLKAESTDNNFDIKGQVKVDDGTDSVWVKWTSDGWATTNNVVAKKVDKIKVEKAQDGLEANRKETNAEKTDYNYEFKIPIDPRDHFKVSFVIGTYKEGKDNYMNNDGGNYVIDFNSLNNKF